MKKVHLAVAIALFRHVYCANNDLFNYRATVGNDYGPEDWNQVTCDDVKLCTGWPDDWLLGEDWELLNNDCKWCPEGTEGCSHLRQSPIDLERNRALEGEPVYKQCVDLHWMKYEDSSCTWNDLVSKNAFSIERHALKVVQPLEYGQGLDEGARLGCPGAGERLFGRIDFSKGFTDWWFLSHIDIKVPSEHSQEGVTYSAEVQMAHFYSVAKDLATADNEMGTVSVFLQAYDDQPPYAHLDRLICEWRKVEDRTREECGLPSVPPYPGCFNNARGFSTTSPTLSPIGEAIPSLAPTLKPPPTSFPTVPTTPDPASAPTIAPMSARPSVTSNATKAPTSTATKVPTLFVSKNPTRLPTASALTMRPSSGESPASTNPNQTPSISRPPAAINVTQAPGQPPVLAPATSNTTKTPTVALTKEPTLFEAPVSQNPTQWPAPSTWTMIPTSSAQSPASKNPIQTPSLSSSPAKITAPLFVATKAPGAASSGQPQNPTNMPTISQLRSQGDRVQSSESTPLPTHRNTRQPVASSSKSEESVRMLRKSMKDLIDDNFKASNGRAQPIILDDINFRPADRSEEEWAEWIEAFSAHERGTASDEQRKLLENDQLSFHNYQFLIDVRTEYYFRYAGTSTVPPCYAKFDGSRANTNHWRLLKDPIRVAPRQIAEMERLLRDRIAPANGNTKACENDTAGKVDSDGHISVARPLQQVGDRHYMVFCECDNWPSKWPEDREWCALDGGNKTARFYEHPYNYHSERFVV